MVTADDDAGFDEAYGWACDELSTYVAWIREFAAVAPDARLDVPAVTMDVETMPTPETKGMLLAAVRVLAMETDWRRD